MQATKELRLSRLPKVLLVHLERFDVAKKVFAKGTEKALILKVRLNLTAVNDIVTNLQPTTDVVTRLVSCLHDFFSVRE